MRLLPSLSLAGLLIALCHAAFAQEWTRFRGPNGSGESEATTIPAQWTEKDINWKTSLPGIGHSSPVVWGDKIFLLSADPDKGARPAMRYVLCVNAGDGQLIWKREFQGVPHKLHNLSSYASCTPAVDEKRIYFAWSDPDHTLLMAMDHSGNDLWTTDFGPWMSMHGFGTSPMLIDDLVVITGSQEPSAKGPDSPQPKDSYVVAVDKENGQIRWKTPRKIDTASFSVPCTHKTADGKTELICCSTAEGIFSLDPKTGKENWSEPVFKLRTVSSPVLVSGLIIATTGQGGGGGNAVVALRPGPKPEIAYEIAKVKAPYVPTPVAKGNLLFLWSDSGFVTCVKGDTGGEVWSERVGSKCYGSPVRVGDKLFCVEDDGKVYCLSASEKFQRLGMYDLKEEFRTVPAIAGGKMYVRTFSNLYSIGGKK
ncbi:MAG: PQQ-binding-like beta-propeller repeat protein [Pirellulaceae bacterium]|nr:PQQ-binding-like beta-propeller repeat protein [Pirellulaceae bacterium]